MLYLCLDSVCRSNLDIVLQRDMYWLLTVFVPSEITLRSWQDVNSELLIQVLAWAWVFSHLLWESEMTDWPAVWYIDQKLFICSGVVCAWKILMGPGKGDGWWFEMYTTAQHNLNIKSWKADSFFWSNDFPETWLFTDADVSSQFNLAAVWTEYGSQTTSGTFSFASCWFHLKLNMTLLCINFGEKKMASWWIV